MEKNFESDNETQYPSSLDHLKTMKRRKSSGSFGVLTVNQRAFAVKPSEVFSDDYIPRKDLKIKRFSNNGCCQVSICIAGSRYSVIGKTAREMGWNIVRESDLWNLYWTDSILGVDFCRDMRRFQKINHFPGMFEICRKDLLARNMNRMLKNFPNEYKIFPKTWCFPADYGEACKYLKHHRNKTFILKPDQGAQGRGIALTKSLKDIKPDERIICQLYISKPLLIDGFKFDLRVYALITSIDPLRVYVYNEGLARFATSPYREPEGHNTTNMYMHLTNYSVNKHSRTFSKDDEAGSKRKFSTLNRILSSEGYDVVSLWNNIDDVIVKTILSAWPMLKHNYSASFPTHDIIHGCFEILGIDIIIDQKLKPWLLEVNHSPSFHTDEPVDKEVKGNLIRDTFTILNMGRYDKRKIIDEDRRKINKRLMKKIKELQGTQTTCNESNSKSETKIEQLEQSILKTTQPWLEQIGWEESHLGGFRRILPCPGDANKYAALFGHQNQASIYCDTVASKKREEAALQIRTNLAEKEKFPLPSKSRGKANDSIERIVKPKIRSKKHTTHSHESYFKVEHICEAEERERLTLLAQRAYLIESCGIVAALITAFYHNNLLNKSERRKYEKENNIDNYKQEEQKLCLKSIKKEPMSEIFVLGKPVRMKN